MTTRSPDFDLTVCNPMKRTLPRFLASRRDCSDRKSTRLNSSHLVISYAVFCLKKKKKKDGLIYSAASLGSTSEITIIGKWIFRSLLSGFFVIQVVFAIDVVLQHGIRPADLHTV